MGSGKRRQLESHAHLLQESRWPASSVGCGGTRLDAVIVPASRPASFLQPIIKLTARLGILLVVLCSAETRVEHVAGRVATTPGARSLIISIPAGWRHHSFPSRTSASVFRVASAGRVNDLSLKRNLGLLLARLHGWNKVAFVDDDINLSQIETIARLARQLDKHQVAGMVVRRHPDNSVVCHARRLAGLFQDVFLTGAALGVHCNSLPLSFFPDVYNEDWFFFAREAAARKLPSVGHATQLGYKPFENPARARQEEFGDLLAEGIYALIGGNKPYMPLGVQLRSATRTYWSQFIEARHEVIAEATVALSASVDRGTNVSSITSALASLSVAESQLDTITADLCVDFLDAWRDDVDDWQKFSNGVSNVGSTRRAMEFLELNTWARAQSGVPKGDSETAA